MNISAKDRQRLRALAGRQMELANSSVMQERVKDWKALNNFRMNRPMILLEMGTFEQEVIPGRLVCEGMEARKIETQLLRRMLPHELFDDDFVVPDHYAMGWHTHMNLFGHEDKREFAELGGRQSVGHAFVHMIEDLEADWDKLGMSEWGVDREGTLRERALLEEALGDILPVRMTMNCLYSVPTQKIVHMMSMENMLFAMMDHPDLFYTLMERIADDTIAYFRWLEAERLLLPTADCQSLGQGTYCYTEELPAALPEDGAPLTTRDVWGFLDSQETVGVSPEMFKELVFPCYRRIAQEVGLLSYGCCEPVDPIWETCLSGLANLRKVSISPWCDQAYMGERLRGRNVVFQRKPSPNYLGVDVSLDEEAVKGHIAETVRAARGCTLEITQRDVYTIHGNPEKARRYVALWREGTL